MELGAKSVDSLSYRLATHEMSRARLSHPIDVSSCSILIVTIGLEAVGCAEVSFVQMAKLIKVKIHPS